MTTKDAAATANDPTDVRDLIVLRARQSADLQLEHRLAVIAYADMPSTPSVELASRWAEVERLAEAWVAAHREFVQLVRSL